MTNARPFSVSTFQNLFNDTKNTPMQGVLPLAVELSTFGSPGGLQIPTLSKCWASPPHLAKVGLRHPLYAQLIPLPAPFISLCPPYSISPPLFTSLLPMPKYVYIYTFDFSRVSQPLPWACD
jgi:hypothetical protein